MGTPFPIGLIGMVTASICLIGVTLTHPAIHGARSPVDRLQEGLPFSNRLSSQCAWTSAGEYPGAVVGAMNSAARVGAFISSVMFRIDRGSRWQLRLRR